MNIDIITTTAGSDTVYYLRHDYDTDIFSGLPGDGPFPSQELAERAADGLGDALASVSD